MAGWLILLTITGLTEKRVLGSRGRRLATVRLTTQGHAGLENTFALRAGECWAI